MTDFVFLVSVKEIIAAFIFSLYALLFSVACYVVISRGVAMFERYRGDADHWHITPEDRHHDIH
jgi:hypothetical protein